METIVVNQTKDEDNIYDGMDETLCHSSSWNWTPVTGATNNNASIKSDLPGPSSMMMNF